ncbi:uncharacterized protein LOC134828676 [Culicoides brevitarsis]|uniref:uncharacterized protein LOC134828676 n=1 Tax=Culicoides brevitarsis TaxID=469753 RepID=UPI00307BC2EB
MFKVWKSNNEGPIILSDKEKQKKIRELRKMIQIADLDVRLDDIYMTRWLNCRDWNVDAAFKRVTKFYNFKRDNPDWYMSKDISHYEPLLQRKICVMLDGRDRRGRRVYLIRAGHMNPDEISLQDMATLHYMWLESIADEPETIENGMAVLLDMKNTSWKLCKWFSPSNSKLSGKFTGLTPLKNFVVHMVNCSTACTTLMGMLSPFFSAELRSKFCLHFKDLSLLHKCLGKEVLPEEYGGNQKLDFDKLIQKLYKSKKIIENGNILREKTKNERNAEINKENAKKCSDRKSNQQIIAALD